MPCTCANKQVTAHCAKIGKEYYVTQNTNLSPVKHLNFKNKLTKYNNILPWFCMQLWTEIDNHFPSCFWQIVVVGGIKEIPSRQFPYIKITNEQGRELDICWLCLYHMYTNWHWQWNSVCSTAIGGKCHALGSRKREGFYLIHQNQQLTRNWRLFQARARWAKGKNVHRSLIFPYFRQIVLLSLHEILILHYQSF